MTKKDYAPFVATRQVLIGYLHETLGQCAPALECYANGCLVEQMRLMYCLVQEFLLRIDKLPPSSSSSSGSRSEPGSPMMPHAFKAVNTLLGRTHSGDSHGSSSSSSAPPVGQFLEAAKAYGPLVAMQAYRLVLELIYRDLVGQLECVVDKESSHLSKELELGSFRTFPGSHRNVGAAQQKSARNR